MKAGTQKAAAPGSGAKYIAAAVVGMLAGAGGVYSWMRSPRPAVIEAPRGEVTEVRRTSPERPSKPIEKRYAETPAPQQPVAELTSQVEPPAEPAHTPAPEPAVPGTIARKININTASAAELELLPEVGPKLAAEIVRHRERFGPFKSVVDLDSVKGVGTKTLAKLAPMVTVGDELP
jgi:competence protein ComEA